jgi:hypothetical protein
MKLTGRLTEFGGEILQHDRSGDFAALKRPHTFVSELRSVFGLVR